jgi:hypothetical protein
VERLGRGNVCAADKCQPYVDRSDLFDVLGLSAKEEPKPEPFELYPPSFRRSVTTRHSDS